MTAGRLDDADNHIGRGIGQRWARLRGVRTILPLLGRRDARDRLRAEDHAHAVTARADHHDVAIAGRSLRGQRAHQRRVANRHESRAERACGWGWNALKVAVVAGVGIGSAAYDHDAGAAARLRRELQDPVIAGDVGEPGVGVSEAPSARGAM